MSTSPKERLFNQLPGELRPASGPAVLARHAPELHVAALHGKVVRLASALLAAAAHGSIKRFSHAEKRNTE